MSLLTASQDKSRADLVAASLIALGLSAIVLLYMSASTMLISYVYPLAAGAIGFWLYSSRPAIYVSFALWIWFITPFVRRLIDYEVGRFIPTNYAMVAPLIVTAVTLINIPRFGARLKQPRFFPLFLALTGVAYGFLVGLVRNGAFGATLGLLSWLLPIVFCFHLLLFWQMYPALRRIVLSTFTWAVLVIGSYTVYQYTVAPAWDMFWLYHSGMTSSMGSPVAGEFRVFGTLNATGPLAKIMMAGVLLMFAGRGLFVRLASVPGYISLLLSLVRTAWGGWFVGLGYLALRLKGALRLQLVKVLGIAFLLGVPLFMVAPNTERVGNRTESFANIEEDGSFKARRGLYRNALPKILVNPIGKGIGAYGRGARHDSNSETSGSMDSGVIELPMTLGWPGALMYLAGLFWMIARVLKIRSEDVDQFAVVATGIGIAFMAMMPFNIQVKGLSGITAWMFFALAYASKVYHDERVSANDSVEMRQA